MMKIAAGLVVLSTVVHLVSYLLPQAMPEHLLDAGWPVHARFHMWQATFWMIALDLVIILIACIPFRSGERWALWALLLAGAGAQGGYFLSGVLVPEGVPPVAGADIGLLAVAGIYLAGLLWGWKLGRP